MQFNFNPPKGFMGGGEVMYSFNFGLDSLNSLGLNMGIRKKCRQCSFQCTALCITFVCVIIKHVEQKGPLSRWSSIWSSDPPRLQKDKAACTGQQLGDGRNLNAAGGG